jgi:hypothetical protein
MYTVFLDEFRAMTASMLLKRLLKVIGDADVKRTRVCGWRECERNMCLLRAWFGTTLQEL